MCSAVSATSEAERAPRHGTILCVDDSETMLIICQTMLEANGYKVHTATGGKEGLQALNDNPIDLVIVDNRMPEMTGAELANEIKRVYKNLPVLMFSDSSDAPTSSDSIDLFLNKKSGPRALCDAVGSLLSRCRESE